jgi:hypothetical protein
MSRNKKYYRNAGRDFDREPLPPADEPEEIAEDFFNNVVQPEPEVEDVIVQPEPPVDRTVQQDRTAKSKHIVSGCRRLNIRKEPSTSSDIIGTFLNSDVVDVVSVINEDWIEVKTRYGVGFIMSKFVEEVE